MIDKDNVPKYARTDDGIKRIAKYIYHPEYENCHSLWFENENCGLLFSDNDLLKMSNNIIELIEVGDYVNGVEVIDLADGIHLEFANDVSFVDVGLATYRDGHVEGIKSIVTKEQFESMEFKL